MAVALGVGAALCIGSSSGLAWADESSPTSGSAASSTSSGPEPGAKPSVTGTTTTTSATTNSTNGTDATDGTVGSAPSAVVGDGGRDEDASAPTIKTPGASKASDPTAAKPAKKKTPDPVSTVADTTRDATATADHHPDDVDRRANVVADPTERPGAASVGIASTPSPSVVAASAQLTPAPPAPPPPDVVDVATALVSGVVKAILSPFTLANSPELPVETPSMWSLLAFARREFETAFHTPSTQAVAPNSVEPGPRTLILSAFPAEADAILARTTLDPNPSVVIDGRSFYLGSIGGKKVIVAMTGIGMVNATQTTQTALAHFTPESGSSIGAVVFSGVAGGSGRTEIGSVAVPARWTSDDGATWHAVDSGMLATADALTVDLESTATLGDPLCLCSPLARLPLVDLKREPQLFIGGDGSSDDDNNGTAFPAIPFGGAIFGPQPCAAPDRSLLFTGNFFQALGPFLAQGLLSNLAGLLAPVHPSVDAVDQETAAAQAVADAHGVPFLGIRGMSDGPGDPLNLPGYPFTFFVYNQLAADNAAIVTEAFLHSWDGA